MEKRQEEENQMQDILIHKIKTDPEFRDRLIETYRPLIIAVGKAFEKAALSVKVRLMIKNCTFNGSGRICVNASDDSILD